MTTTLPQHLLPVLRHVIVWTEDGEERRKPFALKSQALDFQRGLDERGLESKRWRV